MSDLNLLRIVYQSVSDKLTLISHFLVAGAVGEPIRKAVRDVVGETFDGGKG